MPYAKTIVMLKMNNIVRFVQFTKGRETISGEYCHVRINSSAQFLAGFY